MNRRALLTAGATAALISGLLGTAVVLARPGPGLFELDADNPPALPAVTDNTGAGLPDDWDRVAADKGMATNGASKSNATASTFQAETTATGSANTQSIYTGGGSKDDLVISGWRWKDNVGGLPDKDNLLHAMSARYTDTLGTGSEYMFFGADRFDNSGDAQIGFWFFQSPVGPVAGGTFSGAHTARTATDRGDILVLSDFTQGGTQPTIRIYEWVGSGGSNGTLDLIGGDATGIRDCSVVSTDDFCASVNPADGATAPWLFLNKSGQATFGHGEFYEGGVNLNTLGLQNECFPSFLVETRSSQSVSATLKDFVGGSFQNCSPTLATQTSAAYAEPVAPGTAVNDTLTVTGQGVATPPTPTGAVTFYLCGPLASGLCDGTTGKVGTKLTPDGTLSGSGPTATADSPAVNTAANPLTPGRYCFRAEWAGDTTYKPIPPATVFAEYGFGGVTECFQVAKIPTGTTTSPSSGSISLGQTITDTAVVTGTAVGGDPTGDVSFFVCGPIATGSCTTGGTALAGNPKTLVSDGVANTYTSKAESGSYQPPTPGRYCFRAEYVGSTVYLGSEDGTTTECFTVDKLPTGTVTSPSASTISLGQSIFDTAVVTGSSGDGDPTGDVNFFVCGPIASGSCTTGGTPVAGNPTTLVSDGVANTHTSSATSGSFQPGAVGTYCFRAEYGGDDNYTGSEDGSITECFTVTASTSATSEQTWMPNDTATVASTNGAPLSGTLSITLHESDDCTGAAVTGQTYSKTLANATTAAERTLTTNNSTYTVELSKTVSWLVEFTSTNTYVGGSTHCEVTSLTIDN